MILKLIYFLPAALCVYWAGAFLLKERTQRQNIILNCLVLLVPYLIAYAFYCMPDTNMRMLCMAERMGLPIALILLGMLAIYINQLMSRRFHPVVHIVLVIPGIVYGAVLNILYYIIGMEDAVKYVYLMEREMAVPLEQQNRLYDTFRFVDSVLVTCIGATFLLLLILECIYVLYKGRYRFGNFMRFLILGRQANPTNIIAMFTIFTLCSFVPITLLLPNYMQQHQSLALCILVVMLVTMHVLFMSEYNSDIEDFTLKNIIYAKRYYQRKLQERENADMLRKELAAKKEDEQDRSYREHRQVELLREFRRIMEEEQLFLDADVNILDIAKKLNVGRTTLSGIINQAYQKNFRSVVNDYRIEYAKDYIQKHPYLTLEKIAFACGYKDASAFSHKFKEVVNMSPLQWAKQL